jgi:DNA-binding response OmpR family regulator
MARVAGGDGDRGHDGGEDAVVTDAPARVLVVEDDETVAEVVTRYLEREGFAVEAVRDGRDALERSDAALPDLVVLDIMLPGIDGLEVCRRLRARAPVPVVMLTARGGEEDRVLGLELGADDYVAKPFSPRELTARVRAVLRRATSSLGELDRSDTLEFDGLEIDLGAREARVRGQLATLTAREFELLAFLARHPRTVYRRDELLEHVWGYTYGDTSTVTVHIRRLREKIEDDPSTPRRIATVWGVGYRFDP